MRFANYITEGRTQGVTEDYAINFIKKNCGQARKAFMEKGIALYRGHINLSGDYGLIQPSKYERTSANTSNYYTLLMDNSPKWKNYPKRSQSIICGNTKSAAYPPNIFIVFPVDNSKIGVCPRYDLWDSFQDTYKRERSSVDMSMFNEGLEEILRVYAKRSTDISWSALHKLIKLTDSEIAKEGTSKLRSLDYNSLAKIMLSNKMNLSEVLDYIIDPVANNFKLITNTDKLPVNRIRECWTDGDSIIISTDNASGNSLKRRIE